ncbi:MAG: hypothetical protein IH921_00590 [Gemmatimonadetes bacterium]|nr:hypothetical protein [Gemmatimonadota bacterium]
MVLTKTDLLGPDDDPPVLDAPEAWGVFTISSVARKGLPTLLEALWSRIREVIEAEEAGGATGGAADKALDEDDEDWGTF